eukprot:CAMPEP_0184297348 /NCGR_PEP_ID=MMETSP1049-20130417/8275_1 /TAXON_ID=77928 /ORGANISM="Proteomonas sulcata, Strain CCMP704" /LENGTH=52 /DNA_ID=CAMNT_0026607043 /DNA_START=693 /DNA_END=851 /DNA_ORIENTATION=+
MSPKTEDAQHVSKHDSWERHGTAAELTRHNLCELRHLRNGTEDAIDSNHSHD